MLVVNWKKHYNIPTIFYNDTRFTSTRKGKFFFLSDFVFKVIHKFCFKISLFYYMKYLFFHRFQKICKHINKYLFSPFFYLRRNNLKWSMNFLSTHLYKHSNKNLFYKIKLKKYFLRHFYFFICFYQYFKEFIKKSKKIIFFFKLFIQWKKFDIKLFSYVFFYFYNFFYLLNIKKNIIIFKNNNIFFLLYQLKKWRFLIKNYFFFVTMKFSFQVIYNKYVKNYFHYDVILNRKLKKQSLILKKKYHINSEKLKLKNLFYNPLQWKENYLIYFNFFISNFHNLFYYFFSLKKIHSYKTFSFINYVNLNNLVLKKEFFYKFKRLFHSFKYKFKRFRLFYMKRFYKFLSRVLYSKRNWLIGWKHKIKFFKYIFLVFRKIKKAFKKLYFLNKPKYKKKKKMSFYFNSIKVREHFFYYLGKKRYKEEFLLLKNKKWYLKSYLKQYYNVDFKFISNFYFSLNKKWNLKRIKDLFLFLEYNITIFIKKYIFFSFNFFSNIDFSGLLLNDVLIHSSKKNIFFIGDCIKLNLMSLKFKYYYEKFFVFFNIVWYISPFFYKNKFIFLNFFYKKLFNYIKNDFLKRHFFFLKKPNLPRLFFNNKYIGFFSNQLNLHNIFNYKLYVKSLFFFLFKFHFSYQKKKEYDNFFFFDNWNMNELINIYSFCKYYKRYQLIQLNYLNKRAKKRIRKPFFIFKSLRRNRMFFRRKRRKWIKKHINKSLYSYLYRNMTSTLNSHHISIYNKSFRKRWEYENYKSFLLKRIFFLKKKNKLFNFFYNNNF